jgi:hypothetical protein
VRRYLPFPAGPHRHRVGTRTLPHGEWIELGDDADGQLAEKRRLLAAYHEDIVRVVDGPPGPGTAAVRAAGEELLEVLTRHLVERFPDRYTVAGPSGVVDPRTGDPYVPRKLGARLHPVDLAARLVPEDLCLHLPGVDGRLRLVAASVAFPSRWSLAEKMGEAVADIHAPVPSYADAIAHPVDQLLDRLPPERLLWRLNGSILDDAALFQPSGRGRVRSARVPEDIVLRSERQTLRRLPRTTALVFTIRTRVEPLSTIAEDPSACAQVASWLRGLGKPMTAYKSLTGTKPAVLRWLDERAGVPR